MSMFVCIILYHMHINLFHVLKHIVSVLPQIVLFWYCSEHDRGENTLQHAVPLQVSTAESLDPQEGDVPYCIIVITVSKRKFNFCMT